MDKHSREQYLAALREEYLRGSGADAAVGAIPECHPELLRQHDRRDTVPVTFTLGGVAGTQTLYIAIQQ
jgi:hypothetical protein